METEEPVPQNQVNRLSYKIRGGLYPCLDVQKMINLGLGKRAF
jgi:hypothetical protein